MTEQEQKTDSVGKIAATTVSGAGIGEYEWKNLLPLAFAGHCFYCRQDLTGEQFGDRVMERHLNGIVIPETAADRTMFVTVLGIGPKVGTRPSKAHRAEYDWPDRFSIVSGVEVGDRLLIALPEADFITNRIKRSPLNWQDELFVEESLPDAVVED